MSISSDRLRVLTEELIGEGQSKYLFGKDKDLYEVISESIPELTEDAFEIMLLFRKA